MSGSTWEGERSDWFCWAPSSPAPGSARPPAVKRNSWFFFLWEFLQTVKYWVLISRWAAANPEEPLRYREKVLAARRPPIPSASQRFRSFKITRRERRGLRTPPPPLFVIRCQQNFRGVSGRRLSCRGVLMEPASAEKLPNKSPPAVPGPDLTPFKHHQLQGLTGGTTWVWFCSGPEEPGPVSAAGVRSDEALLLHINTELCWFGSVGTFLSVNLFNLNKTRLVLQNLSPDCFRTFYIGCFTGK